MNILIGLVIAMFIIVGGYVGYHASQQIMVEDAEGHDIIVELETLNENMESFEIFQSHEIRKSII
jgi:hypothetical protein